MIKFIKLNEQFDIEKIKGEVNSLNDLSWINHYNKNHYNGNWTILPLRAINGDPNNILSIHATANTHTSEYRDTEFLHNCPYLKSVIDFFECEKTSVRLMKLQAGAVIKEHTDHEMSFEEGEARFHIPIITNPLVEFYLDDERVIMNEGECWYLNLSLKHRVANHGANDRIHLVIDCKVNDWIKHKFSESATKKKEIDNEQRKEYSRDDKLKIIDNLRLMNTAVANEMANKMEKELQ